MKQSASTLTEEPEFLKEYKQKVHNKLAKKKKLKKHNGKESNHVKPVKKEKYKGEVRNDKVLVLLVDFKDYKHNSIKKKRLICTMTSTISSTIKTCFSEKMATSVQMGNEKYP